MPHLLVILLLAILAGGAVMAVRAWRGRCRRTELARLAGDLGFRYSREDPFDIPGRYASFALLASGHSPAAVNVISGHLEGLSVRAFDFQYEAGHGTRRMTRRYGVVLLETDLPQPRLLMWHNGDFAPVPARLATRTQGPWSLLGDVALTDAFLSACASWFPHGGCVEINGPAVLLAAPGLTGRNNLPPLPDIVKAIKPLLT